MVFGQKIPSNSGDLDQNAPKGESDEGVYHFVCILWTHYCSVHVQPNYIKNKSMKNTIKGQRFELALLGLLIIIQVLFHVMS